ncbi:hypothetical protein [Embleya sp. NPDC005971]|uniref:hypothetical protein n=1 Tax=Embleya sp. NPDC005971 TaxID=3156724 RepID=UPI0033E4B12B
MASTALVSALSPLACTQASTPGSRPLADLPPVLAGATRIVADGRGADFSRRLDGDGDGRPVTASREYS